MVQVRNVIKKALQLNGVLTKGEDPDGDEMQDALSSLNAMLSSWSNDSLLVFYQKQESFPLSGSRTYTIGPSADFDTTRPAQIVSAFVRIGDIDYDLKVINGNAYDSNIAFKDLGGIPSHLFYDNNNPVATVTIWPVPTAGYTLFLRTENQLVQFSSINDDVILPPGWERALNYNLAVEISPEYGQQLPEATVVLARESKAMIKSASARVRNYDVFPVSGNQDNIYSGWWTY